MKKKVIKVISTFLNLFLVLLALIFASAVLATSQNKVPQVLGYSIMRIISPSMAPDINVNDYIIVKKVDVNSLTVGDIITFYSPDPQINGKPNTHRIVEIHTDEAYEFITKGTANQSNDEYIVIADRVIGKFVGKANYLNFFSPLLKNPILFFTIVAASLMLMTAIEKIFEIRSKKNMC